MSLTDNQKELIKWFVRETHEGRLSEEFYVVWLLKGGSLLRQDFDGNSHPTITKGTLDALERAGLLICDPTIKTTASTVGRKHPKITYRQNETNRRCVLTPKAYEAVASNFESLSADTFSGITLSGISNSQLQIQQGSPNATQTGTLIFNEAQKGELTNFVKQLETKLSDLELEIDDYEAVKEQVETIEIQLRSKRTNPGIVKECLKTVRNVLEGMTGSIIATELLQQLSTFLR